MNKTHLPKAETIVDAYKTVATMARSLGRILMPNAWAIEIHSQAGSFLDRRTRYCLAGASWASAIPTFSGSISTLQAWDCYSSFYLLNVGRDGIKSITQLFATYVIIVFHFSVRHVDTAVRDKRWIGSDPLLGPWSPQCYIAKDRGTLKSRSRTWDGLMESRLLSGTGFLISTGNSVFW